MLEPLREVVNAILYITKTGVQWAYLPHDSPAKSTVYDRFAAWKKDGTWQSIVATLTGDLDPHNPVCSTTWCSMGFLLAPRSG